MPRQKKIKVTATATKRALGENQPKLVKRGEDMYGYGEQKKTCNLTLTPTVKDKLCAIANELGISRSEVVERWVRNENPINTNQLDLTNVQKRISKIMAMPGTAGLKMKREVAKIAEELGLEAQ